MFDISFGEISLIGLIALLVLGPKEMLVFYKSVRKAIASLRNTLNGCMKDVSYVLGDEDIVDIVLDVKGRPHKAYKLEKIMPYIKDKKEDE